MVPRARSSEAGALAAAVSKGLGEATPVIAFISGGQKLALHVASGLSGSAHAFTLSPEVGCERDDAFRVVAGEQASGNSGPVLLFAEPTAPGGFMTRALLAIGSRWPGGAVAGMQVAPPKEPGTPTVFVGGTGVATGGLAGLVLPGTAQIGIELLGCKPFGEEMEVFEADIRKGNPVTVLKIGTDEEGDIRDAAETEKGTAGIARRVDVPAAAALKAAMTEASVSGPKEVFVGLPRKASSQDSTMASNWSLVNWVGVTKSGGVVLGGGDPMAENLCPKGALNSVQYFRVAPAAEDWKKLAASVTAGANKAYAALALAAGRGISPKEGELATGMAAPLGAFGVSVLGKAEGGDVVIHRQAGAVVVLCDT